MPSYKLTYFNGRGRGEISRMLFAAAGVKFEDVRIEFKDWPALKPKTPQGTLPLLEIDGKAVITQSMSVARYLAREFGLDGKSKMEKATVDMIMDTLLDLFGEAVKFAFNSDEAEKKKMQDEFEKGTAQAKLGQLEELVKNGTKGFAVGKELTFADLMLYVYLENSGCHKLLDKYKMLKENRATIEKMPKIKAYLEKRQVTQF